MKKNLFVRVICLAALLVLSISPAFAAGVSSNLLKTADDTAVYLDPGLQETYGVLPAGSVVYVNEYMAFSGGAVLQIVFCQGYIIRPAYIPLMTAFNPLTDAEAEAYAAKASSEGIVFKPGVVLLNTSFLTGEYAPQPAVPSADASGFAVEDPAAAPDPGFAVEDPGADAAPGFAVETLVPETPVPATPVPATPAPTQAPAADTGKKAFFTETTENGLAALPFGKRYLLNIEDPIPDGTSIRSIVLPVLTPGHAQGVIDYAVCTKGVFIVRASILFDLDVAAGATKVTIPAAYECKRNTYVMVRYIKTSTCRFAATESRRDKLPYFSDLYGVFLSNPTAVEGYRIDWKYR